MSSKRLGAILEQTLDDRRESIKFLSVQVKLWRSFSIIHAHHPEIAKTTMLQMALNGTLVGSIEKFERLERRVTKQAQRCGVTMGVFAPDIDITNCNGLTAEQLWSDTSEFALERKDEK